MPNERDFTKPHLNEHGEWVNVPPAASGNGAATDNVVSMPRKTAQRRLQATPAAKIQREQVEWLEPGRVPIGLVTVLAGVGGLGKSQWTCLLAARLSRGELGEPGVTLIATAEDSPSTTVVPRLEALEANLELVHFLTIKTKEGDEDGIAIPDDLAALQAMVATKGVRLLVIDPLVAHLPMQIDSHRDQAVRGALAPLYRLANETGCAVVAILHLNKSQGMAPLARLGGSIAFGNAARSVLLLDREPDDDTGTRRVLAHIKCNVGPHAPSLLYRVAPIVLEAKGNAPMVTTSRLELLGETEHDGESILGDDDDRTALEEAVDFLRDTLGDGERHQAKGIFREAHELHIADRTLQRARKRLGAKSEKAGFGRAGWEWWLPGAKATASPSVGALAPMSPSKAPKEPIDDIDAKKMESGAFGDSALFDDGAEDDIPF
jgi:RecA-family ATPase